MENDLKVVKIKSLRKKNLVGKNGFYELVTAIKN
jgi:hypothetical protein